MFLSVLRPLHVTINYYKFFINFCYCLYCTAPLHFFPTNILILALAVQQNERIVDQFLSDLGTFVHTWVLALDVVLQNQQLPPDGPNPLPWKDARSDLETLMNTSAKAWLSSNHPDLLPWPCNLRACNHQVSYIIISPHKLFEYSQFFVYWQHLITFWRFIRRIADDNVELFMVHVKIVVWFKQFYFTIIFQQCVYHRYPIRKTELASIFSCQDTGINISIYSHAVDLVKKIA